MLGEDNVQGLKQGYTSGNHVYYMGGVFLVQRQTENETVGLTHCFHHDLRSRGVGYGSHPNYTLVGTGNDFKGWEFYRSTKIAECDVINSDGLRWTRPAPTAQYWRPDGINLDYVLTSPYLDGWYDGVRCANLDGNTLSAPGGSGYINNLRDANNVLLNLNVTAGQQRCADDCAAEPTCEQATYEYSTPSSAGGSGYGHVCFWGSARALVSDSFGSPRNVPDLQQTACWFRGIGPVRTITIHEEKHA
jgi:hypothetical protein